MCKKIVILLAILELAVISIAETWRIGSEQQWQKTTDSNDNPFISAVSQAKQFASNGQTSKTKKAYKNLKKNYPTLAGSDYDEYAKAEILFSKRKFPEAAKAYDNFIEKYPQSPLWQSAMEREFQLGTAFLNGQKRTVLKVFKLHAYEEGTEIMNKIADRAGDAPIAKRAIETLAISREKRGAYDEAYLAWADAANRWPTGDIGQESLMGMARSLDKDYKGPSFDGKVLISSKSYYSEYLKRYPESAQQLEVSAKLNELDKKIAEKELAIADYYARTTSYTAANLYYQKIIDDWPSSGAAKGAEIKLPEIKKQLELSKSAKKKFNWKGLLL